MAGRPLRSLRARSNPRSRQWSNVSEFLKTLTPQDKKNIAELTHRFQKESERHEGPGQYDTPDHYAIALLMAMYFKQPFRTYMDLTNIVYGWSSDQDFEDSDGYYDMERFAYDEIRPLYPEKVFFGHPPH